MKAVSTTMLFLCLFWEVELLITAYHFQFVLHNMPRAEEIFFLSNNFVIDFGGFTSCTPTTLTSQPLPRSAPILCNLLDSPYQKEEQVQFVLPVYLLTGASVSTLQWPALKERQVC